MKNGVPPGRLDNAYEEQQCSDSPPEPTLVRRAASYSDFYHVVRAQLVKDGQLRCKKKPGKKNTSWEALALQTEKSHNSTPRSPAIRGTEDDDELLKDAQQEYMYEAGLPQFL